MSDLGFVVLAYSLTWTTLGAFVLYLVGRRRRALARQDANGRHTGGDA